MTDDEKQNGLGIMLSSEHWITGDPAKDRDMFGRLTDLRNRMENMTADALREANDIGNTIITILDNEDNDPRLEESARDLLKRLNATRKATWTMAMEMIQISVNLLGGHECDWCPPKEKK